MMFLTLIILNLPSLKYRRLRGDMILVYRLLKNDVDIDFNDFFTTPTLTSTRGHLYKLYKPNVTSRSRSDFFSIRAINHWNKLPDYVVTAQTLNGFKNELDNFLFEQMIDF